MAKFECHNCGNEFEKFCDDAIDATNIKCPSCGSHWTNIIFKEESHLLPVIPTYPKPNLPNFGPFPYDPLVPWPHDGWRITCEDGTGPINKPIRYSINKSTGSVSVWL